MEPPLPDARPKPRISFWDACASISELLVTFLGLAAIVGILYLAVGQAGGQDPRGAVAPKEYDATTSVQCGSRSMGLVVRCNDTLLLREVKHGQALKPGHIYIYGTTNGTVVHRYVACVEHCQVIIMKGDENRIAEKINRTDIQYEVIGTYYDNN